MVRKSSVPAAIEGMEIQVIGHEIRPSDIPRPTKDNFLMFPVSAKRRAVGVIILESNPKTTRFRDYSLLDQGDEIVGPYLWGLSSFPITINVGGAGRTSKHAGQETMLNGQLCFLEIVSGWRGNTGLLIHPQKFFLK